MKPDKNKKEIRLKYTDVGHLQSTDRAIDQTPIYYFAVTKPIRGNTVVRWDAGTLVLQTIERIEGEERKRYGKADVVAGANINGRVITWCDGIHCGYRYDSERADIEALVCTVQTLLKWANKGL
jgi:hypothetical protein